MNFHVQVTYDLPLFYLCLPIIRLHLPKNFY